MSSEILGPGDNSDKLNIGRGAAPLDATGDKGPLENPAIGGISRSVFSFIEQLRIRSMSGTKLPLASPITKNGSPVGGQGSACKTSRVANPCFSPIDKAVRRGSGTSSDGTWSLSRDSTPRDLSSSSFGSEVSSTEDSFGGRTTADTLGDGSLDSPIPKKGALTIDTGDEREGLTLDIGGFDDEGMSVEEYIGNEEEIPKTVIEKQTIDGVEEEVLVEYKISPYDESLAVLAKEKGRRNPHGLLEALVAADKKGWIEARVGKSIQDMTAAEKVQLVRYGHIITDFSSLKGEDLKVFSPGETEGDFSRDLASILLKISQGSEGVSCEVSGEGKSGSNIFYKNGEPFCIEKPVKGDIGCDSAIDAHVCPVSNGGNVDRRKAGNVMIAPGMGPYFEALAYNLSSESLGMSVVPPTVIAYSAHEKSSVLGHRVLDELPAVVAEKSHRFTEEDQDAYREFIENPATDESIDTFQNYFLYKLLSTNERTAVETAEIDTSSFDTKGFMQKAKDASVVEIEGILQAKVAEAISGTEEDKAAASRSFKTLVADLGEGYKVYAEVTDSLLKGEEVEAEKFETFKDYMLNYLEECKISHEYREKLEEAIAALPSQIEVMLRLIAEIKSPINEKGIALFEQAIDSLREDPESTTAKVDFINASLKLYFQRSSLEGYEGISVEVNSSKTPKDILQKCSFQKMVAGASSWSWSKIKEKESSVPLDQWQDIMLLDLLVFNADRNYQNIIFKEDEEGRTSVYAVDHSVILPRESFSKFDPCWRDLECSKQPWSEANRDKIVGLDTESVLKKSALNFFKMLELPIEEGVDIESKDLGYIAGLLPKDFQVHLETLENQIIMLKLMSELEMTPREIAYTMYKVKEGFSGRVMQELCQLTKSEGGEAKVKVIIKSARALEKSAIEKLAATLDGLGKTEEEKQALVEKVFSRSYATPELEIHVPFFNLLVAKASSKTMLEKTDAEQAEKLSSLSDDLLTQAIDEVLLEGELLSLKEKVKETFIAEAEASPLIDEGKFIKKAISDEDKTLSALREELIEKISSDPEAFKSLVEAKKTELLEKVKADYQVAVLYQEAAEELKGRLLSRGSEEDVDSTEREQELLRAKKEEEILFSLLEKNHLMTLIEARVEAATGEDPRVALLSDASYQEALGAVAKNFDASLFLEGVKTQVLNLASQTLRDKGKRGLDRLGEDLNKCLEEIDEEGLSSKIEEAMASSENRERLIEEIVAKTISAYNRRTRVRGKVNLKVSTD
ncbi:MAG: hypothetical protein L7U87_04785 [Chlamydiales bacterium]|nr:hypothetical protein [Chlamydiales bacterium]